MGRLTVFETTEAIKNFIRGIKSLTPMPYMETVKLNNHTSIKLISPTHIEVKLDLPEPDATAIWDILNTLDFRIDKA